MVVCCGRKGQLIIYGRKGRKKNERKNAGGGGGGEGGRCTTNFKHLKLPI